MVYVVSNLIYAVRLSADTLIGQRIFVDLDAGSGFEILITVATMIFRLHLLAF